MQYILTRDELIKGCELREMWIEKEISIGEVYDKSEALNKQGFYTVIECYDIPNELYSITVFNRVNHLVL